MEDIVRPRLKKLKNKKGVVLILALLGLSIPLILSSSLSLLTTSEQKQSYNYRDSVKAFWLAEAGIQRYLKDPSIITVPGRPEDIDVQGYTVTIDQTDEYHSWGIPKQRVLTSSATVNNIERTLSLTFPPLTPNVFDNTISGGNNLTLTALFAGIDIDHKTRISGSYSKYGLAIGLFDDKVEGVDSYDTTLRYPDMNNNDTSDEFNDFILYNREMIAANYTEDEYIYIDWDDYKIENPTATEYPILPNNQEYRDKKIIYVESETENEGDVEIIFGSSWAANQNITVISTGNVKYVQPLQNPAANSQLNTISWDSYQESAVFYSTHSGVTFSHKQAQYGSILSVSETTGNLLANEDISFILGGVWKMFYYSNPIDELGLVPPGFEGLITGGVSGFSSTPCEWKEI